MSETSAGVAGVGAGDDDVAMGVGLPGVESANGTSSDVQAEATTISEKRVSDNRVWMSLSISGSYFNLRNALYVSKES